MIYRWEIWNCDASRFDFIKLINLFCLHICSSCADLEELSSGRFLIRRILVIVLLWSLSLKSLCMLGCLQELLTRVRNELLQQITGRITWWVLLVARELMIGYLKSVLFRKSRFYLKNRLRSWTRRNCRIWAAIPIVVIVVVVVTYIPDLVIPWTPIRNR